MESDLTSVTGDLLVDLEDVESRHDAEAVLDALFHRLQVMARAEPGGINGDGAVQLRVLAARLRATLDRTPEMYAHLQSEGHKAAPFAYEADEVTPERAVEVAGFLGGKLVRMAAESQAALGKTMNLANTDKAHERRAKREAAEQESAKQ